MKKLTKKIVTIVLAMTMLMGLTLTANAKTKSSPQPQYVVAYEISHNGTCGYPQGSKSYMLMTDETPKAGTTITIKGIPQGSGVWGYAAYKGEFDFEIDTYLNKNDSLKLKNGECTFTILPGKSGSLKACCFEIVQDDRSKDEQDQECLLKWEKGVLINCVDPSFASSCPIRKIPVNQVPGYENYGQPATQVTQDKTQEELLAQYYAALAKQQAKKK